MSPCLFEEYEPDKCIGHVLSKVFRRYPHLSDTSLTYFTDMEHEYPYPHETALKDSNLILLPFDFQFFNF